MPDRRHRRVPDLDERDLEGTPMVVLAAMLALFDQVEGLRPLLPEELSARYVVEQVREGRNQLLEERFGRGEVQLGGRRYVPSQGQFKRRHDDDAGSEAD